MLYCIWPNDCDTPTLCCSYCTVKKCPMRCHDNCSKCKYTKTESEVTEEPVITYEKTAPKIIVPDIFNSSAPAKINKFSVRIGSGNGRGKTYYFDDIYAAKRKARILEARQKSGHKSIILQGEMINGQEYYPETNKVQY